MNKPPDVPNSIRFEHGLGDNALFAHTLPLYLKRGHDLHVKCRSEFAPLFMAAGCKLAWTSSKYHHYLHPPGVAPEHNKGWQQNKAAFSISHSPMPDIGTQDSLWDELLQVKLNLDPFVTNAMKREVLTQLDSLHYPVILFHPQGVSIPSAKDLNHQQQEEFLQRILDTTTGTVIVLDPDNKAFKMKNNRVVHLLDWKRLSLMELYFLMCRSSLLVGIDSGPLHFARYTSLPCVGVWHGHHPAHYALPRKETVHVLPRGHQWTPYKREEYQLRELDAFNGAAIADVAVEMLTPPKYLPDVSKDVVLRGQLLPPVPYTDRHRAIDAVLVNLKNREEPSVLSLGVDSPLGYFVRSHGGSYTHVTAEESQKWLMHWSMVFDAVHLGDGFNPEDLLFLVQMLRNATTRGSMILIEKGGEKAIPWLLELGWGFIYNGGCTVMAMP